MLRACASLLLLCMVTTFGWTATTYYVATNGDDKAPGTSAKPFKTIQRAADIVSPGDTVIVRDGVYADWQPLGYSTMVMMKRGGTAERPIVFRSEHKWGAVLDGSIGIPPYPEGRSQAWLFGGVSYITVDGFEIRNFTEYGFRNSASDNAGGCHYITMKNNKIHHILGQGFGDSTFASHNTFTGNLVYDIGLAPPDNCDHGVYTSGDYDTFTNNIFYDCHGGRGIQVAGYDTVEGDVIANNVFAWSGGCDQLVLWAGDRVEGHPGFKMGLKNITVENNIFYYPPNGTAAIMIYNGGDFHNITIRNNLLYGGNSGLYRLSNSPELEVHVYGNMDSDYPAPLFVNADFPPYDFHLKADSSAIDAGIAALAPDHDCDGSSRPAGKGCDIGPYEYQAEGTKAQPGQMPAE